MDSDDQSGGRDDAAHHIRTRSQRYPDAADIEPSWTVEVVDDPDRIVDRPARAKVLSVRLNPEEFDALHHHAEQLELPVSALVRGWILTQLRADTEGSPAATVDRIARQVEQLRRQLAS